MNFLDAFLHYLHAGQEIGSSNVIGDPLFVDPENGDFHLASGSPAINAGTDTGYSPISTDSAAPDGIPDIGIYDQ